MIKQKTSNSFQTGLVQDYNPLIQENTSLSNCLNGTFITNDGDELILQNDMGNARVYQIKLDNGYVPVGMCEYGGVTYIASYNPVTNKSQIGSFPSPQETFFSRSWGEDTVLEDTICTLGSSGNNNARLEFIKQIFNTTDIIRPGDKFDLYVKDSNYYKKELISNTDNTIAFNKSGEIITEDSSDKKPVRYQIKSPKNKAITLSVCVADSSGNLHDITSTLKRYTITEEQEVIPFSEDTPEKLNTGTIFRFHPSNSSSIVDNYQADPSNIYNYKISGNLFLVYRINSLDSVEITAEFFKGPLSNIDKYIDIPNDMLVSKPWVENKLNVRDGCLTACFNIIYRYNCPDGYYDDKVEENGIEYYPITDPTGTYYSLYGWKEDFRKSEAEDYSNSIYGIQADGYTKGDTTEHIISTKFKFDTTTDLISKPEYNFDSNLYTSRQRQGLFNIELNNGKILKFDLIPALKYGYLDFFKQTIEVDIDKLNSGEVSISQWRYFVDNSGVRISLGLETYPFYGTRLTDVTLDFYKLTNPTLGSAPFTTSAHVTLNQKTSYHGTNDIQLNFDEEFTPGHIYCVIISYKITNIANNNQSTGVLHVGARTLITTRLYNKIYQDPFILDFNKLDDKDWSLLHTYDPNIQIADQLIQDRSLITLNGTYLNPKDGNTDVAVGEETSVTKIKEVDMTKRIVVTLDHSNDYLYPFNIQENSHTFDSGSINIISTNILEDDSKVIGDSSYRTKVLTDIKNSELYGLTARVGNALSGDIIVSGKLLSELKGTVKEDNINFSNAITQYFPSFGNEMEWAKNRNFQLYGYNNPEEDYSITCGITYRGLSGHQDHHGAKYIEVDMAKRPKNTDGTYKNNINDLTDEEYKNIMTDLHEQIYGSTWDYPEVMKVGDKHIKFSLTDFVSNDNFLKYIKNKTFILFNSKFGSPGKYNDETVSDWISLDRQGLGDDDKKVRNIYYKPLLFWKYNEVLYLISSSSSLEDSYSIQSFQQLMDNLYFRADEEISLNNIRIISNDSSAYNTDYQAHVQFKVNVTPKYRVYIPNSNVFEENNHTYNDILKERLTTVIQSVIPETSVDELVKYVQFNFNYNDPKTIESKIIVEMEGFDSTKTILEKLSNGVYGDTVLIDSFNMLHIEDKDGNALLTSQAYEVDTTGKVSIFGTQIEKNRKLKANIQIEGSKIVPGRTINISKDLIVGGSGDQKTTLALKGQSSIVLSQ